MVVLATPIPGYSDVDLGVVRFGNPFPASWSLILGFTDGYFVPYSLPGARRAAKIPAFVFAQARLGAQVGQPLRPQAGHDVETQPNKVELAQAGATVVTGIVVP